jgi:superfamily II DNA helicase RecQ
LLGEYSIPGTAISDFYELAFRILILGLSATLPPHTLEYIHQSLCLNRDSILCSMGVDRPNITLFTVPLARGDEASMKTLMNLIPEAARVWKGSDDRRFNPLSLPKRLIFIDDRSKCCSAVTQLQGLFPLCCRSESCNWATEIIQEYHSGLSSQGLQKTLALFRKGACRYLVCTGAVGMKLDIPDIKRIIQRKLRWGVFFWRYAFTFVPSIIGLVRLVERGFSTLGVEAPACVTRGGRYLIFV